MILCEGVKGFHITNRVGFRSSKTIPYGKTSRCDGVSREGEGRENAVRKGASRERAVRKAASLGASREEAVRKRTGREEAVRKGAICEEVGHGGASRR